MRTTGRAPGRAVTHHSSALGPGALGPDALGPDALGPDALSPGALGPDALEEAAEPADGRRAYRTLGGAAQGLT
jgi:hypothetical protein